MLECTVRIVRMGEDIFIKRKTTFDTLLYIWIFRTDCGFVRKKKCNKINSERGYTVHLHFSFDIIPWKQESFGL